MFESESFNNYVETFKKLPLQEKKVRVVNELQRLLTFIEKAKQDLNIRVGVLYNKEVLDLNTDKISDDDFVEAMLVYVHSIQEALGSYFNETAKYVYRGDNI